MPTGEDTAVLVAMLIANPSDKVSRRSVTASKLLWSRVSKIEELQLKLVKMQRLLGDLLELHEDIAARLSEDMNEAVQTATIGVELRQRVGT
ncbi:uncharacterized protein PITG_18957 [Phytophthora infestans T30-4]|uniref:Uncharacterized protein n=1 Tax=Phytophthora infestans (strain T30-4) TaxID=403677 RepID=D0NZ72_PHYIT|nr:uncharacterized protein PITG_18957 [Phytophthora infestans T30-4]EEY68866.1 hypothetical protein PITG_18957 [Phytophthora infestans T30-4]KAI9990080.1 hypothetical protein PInf_020390 [Phytophthora infestans]|eukprot:XP_002997325.1 hypothetical protein PITG_18957 [Phytophthora infestans T30-4]